MLRRSLCALTVVTFAACSDNRSGMPGNHGDASTSIDLAEPSIKDAPGTIDNTPAESADAAEGVGPGLIIMDTSPSASPPSQPVGAAEVPPTTVDSPPVDLKPR